ncbi:MAG: hypothetical protein R3F61_28845 [Myxococcota bacterium]
MSNPFVAPDGPVVQKPDASDEIAGIVIAMRFPQLLLGGLYALGSLGLLGFGGVAFLGSLGPMNGDEALLMRVFGGVYAVMGGLALVPSALLVRSGLAALLARSEPEQVVTSLRAQLWFWRVLALYVLGTTALYALGFFAFVLVGILGAI